ncbi:molybdopterin molybdenumtransferase MoeA [Spirochaetia bacterium]|nr:molybdopterin molybdenumtransferase MoeA [Spirochaetia bacterium]
MERISLETALELALERTNPITETINVKLLEAHGLIATCDIHAPIDNPPFDRSPLDGFALLSADTAAASKAAPVRLCIVGTCYAGEVFPEPLHSGAALKIMTGAPMPKGADAMLPKEAVKEEGGCVLVFTPVKQYDNYVFKGEDIPQGQVLIQSKERLDFIRLGILAGMGFDTVSVYRPPEIGILCTGEELVPPGAPLTPGKIYNNNGILLATRLKELGFHAQLLPVSPDDAPKAAAQIRSTLEHLDILITTGAVSVGDKDIMHEVFDRVPVEKLFWGMNFKPGSAMACGVYKEKLLLCLSGNPFAAMTTLELVVVPVLAKLAHLPHLQTRYCYAQLGEAFPKKSDYRRFIRAHLEPYNGTDAHPLVSITEKHSSSQLLSLLNCNCFVDIPAGSDSLPAGCIVKIALFNNVEPKLLLNATYAQV